MRLPADPNEYSLFFANCHHQYQVSMNVHTEMYNMEGDVKDFLPAGWSFLKPYLQEREKKVLMIVIPLQVFANIASIVIDETVTAYKYKWVSNCAEEAVSLAFYIFIFYKFQPVDKNPYFVIDDEEEEAVALATLRDEDFDI
ncbi:hypothetical protein SUGI_0028160 [Cryptomeria japonica]|nr:hypothetical protein SUGI_0028160 [Cryptomeria japonica]